ncbi:FaeA/PapI family transcriptional regulator [Aeromonas sp. MdU4]|uniref:FaeA/PapI family transcriptional regulator n=1 Tax=Aeromonas sp. MdU4 TaxID=3342819 RepID=UPI0035BB614F
MTHRSTQEKCNDILYFLNIHKKPVSTTHVSKEINITIYQARYYLKKLAMAGLVKEIRKRKGVTSLWLSYN